MFGKKMKLMLLAARMFFYEVFESLHWKISTAGVKGFMSPICLFAMDEGEQAAFDAAKKEAEEAKAKLAEYEKNNPPNPPDDKTSLEKAREKEEEAKKEAVLVEAAKFNATFKSIVDGDDGFFPNEANAVLEDISKKKYDSELDRANDLRASIAESVFSVQKNIDLLPEIAKAKVSEFMGLSQKAKEKQSSSIWEYVLTALDIHKRVAKLDRAEQARRGISTATGSMAVYEKKVFGLRDKKSDKQGE